VPSITSWTRRVAALFPRHVWIALFAGFAAAYLAGAVVALLVKQAHGWTAGTAWDVRVLERVHHPLPRWLDLILLSVPWLGTNITILAVQIPWSVWQVRRGHTGLVTPLAAISVGNYLLNLLMKLAFGRSRPSLWARRGEYTWASYPSGHAIAMLSVVLFAAWLLRRQRGWRWPIVLWVPAFLAMVYSRVYLGVHWPTDVVGGVAIGIVWFVSVWLAFRGWPWPDRSAADELRDFR
jgi:membrane-associated phospholipid phosphatase